MFSFEIARNISPSSYGLVFGINTFLALGFQTILTTIVADSAGFALEPRQQVGYNFFLFAIKYFTQFRVYAGFFLVTGCGYLIMGLVNLVLARGRRRNQLNTA